jgi:tetratricopeptide (TPR) repeat protein/O-antigen ligase
MASAGWNQETASGSSAIADTMRQVVDLGLCGVIFVAPYFFGGRHDLGRLVLVSIVAVTAIAYFARQTMLATAGWPRTVLHVLFLAAAGLLILQIVPLPPWLVDRLSPHTAELLPLWSSGNGDPSTFGAWRTVSLYPHETTKALAMLAAYGLLFAVVAGRIQEQSDIEQVMKWIALAAAAMAGFGIVHHLTTDGRFFWFYSHPYRSARTSLSGAFVNRNHFADYLVLGVGPLAGWLLHVVAGRESNRTSRRPAQWTVQQIVAWALAGAVALVILAILGSTSRGGAIALLVAGSVLLGIYASRGLVDIRLVFGLIGLAVVVVGLLSLRGYDEVVHRLDDFAEGTLDGMDSRAIRRTVWSANIAAFQSAWPAGVGAGVHREICPVYMEESFGKEFSHAENGYLQVATETGMAGVLLLGSGIMLCACWFVSGFRHAERPAEIRSLGAAAAGLAASLAHSLVDFVWYIPACMSVTVILAACVFRQSQMARASKEWPSGLRVLPAGRWFELTAGVALVSAWMVQTYVGPAMAAIYSNRYLRVSATNEELARRQMWDVFNSQPAEDPAGPAQFNDLMMRQLEEVVRWDPQCARGHLRLAAKYIARFEMLQQHAENAMGLAQIRDAVAASNFDSPAERNSWLRRAIGPNIELLLRAADEARQAVCLCPLQGEGYVYLAQLSFLEGATAASARSYIDQAMRVRPQDADIRFEVGLQELMAGNLAAAIENWKQCFDDRGPHQLKTVYLLAGRLPAPLFLSTFQPNWQTLQQIWKRYREQGQASDLDALLAYSVEATRLETSSKGKLPPGFVWYWQSTFYRDVQRHEEALACLERAYACDRNQFSIRYALAAALERSGRLAEAEPHFRWCLARRPHDKGLSTALVRITKERLAQQPAPKQPPKAAAAEPGLLQQSVRGSESPSPSPGALRPRY